MKALINKDDAEKVAVAYSPRKFPMTISAPAQSFHAYSTGTESSFRIDRLVAEQTGVAELERLSLEEKVEKEALLRLKDLQEAAYQEAYQLGLDEGRDKAFEEHKEELGAHLQNFGLLIASVERMKADLVASNETQIVNLVFQIAKRLAVREIAAQPNMILDIVREAIEGAQSEENVTVRVSAGDLALIEALKEKLGKDFEGVKRARIESSDDIQSGGCVVETNYGDVNATIERRLEKLWEAFAEKLPKVKDTVRANPES